MNNSENSSKPKNLKKLSGATIVVILLSIVLIVVGVIIFINKPTTLPPSKPKPADSEEKDEIGEVEGNKINQVILYGIEIYKSGTYTELPQSSSGYYITKAQLKEKGYDVSDLVINCSDNSPIIFFDTSRKLEDGQYPISVVYNCQSNKKADEKE